ncbi:hypothetical protein HM1_2751 [Heliomicrobium modesticaldum Ice1]|uniref:Uncharacterized protein n=1 Tax=Heliobacterium modesticaldum (strain ATCC 51547 / Ice1) TaxID=498761 RepID=B0TC07_HELMI|nr:hypothetical protein HM1_2751 [Heliomicrobium modesticaldum Ice1]
MHHLYSFCQKGIKSGRPFTRWGVRSYTLCATCAVMVMLCPGG